MAFEEESRYYACPMVVTSSQHVLWKGAFGDAYVKRNFFTPRELDADYKKTMGITRSAMNKEFLGTLKKDIRILEVGMNFGLQLEMLQKMGFTNLYGIDLNEKALETARKTQKNISIVHGDALDIPFKDNYFDLVFTADVLIHIAPKNRKKVMSEIYRASKKYIWGYEYFAEKSTEVPYRGHRNVLWKAPFSKLYREAFPDLKVVHEKKYKYTDNNNVDEMFLLRKFV